MTSLSRPWFAAKRYGFGAGLPIAWQGWAAFAGYLALTLTCSIVMERGDTIAQRIALAALVLATIALIKIAKSRTRGGWRWRWGEAE
ncbi:MAG: hypothetical protein QNI87_07115 [Erythrobacter sp.]|uniref:hypothetical protein n=1 Tax=Erythrobacter sp. TaxID=1042 RepID=UPI00260C7184|nr:hypothetical protein [Erythrobacter sp.]MDJ0978289.1 hypothetical protein [Erythrobacter sp.]